MTTDEYKNCRRRNYVHAAYVEAAIHLNTKFGSDRAYWVLLREKVPAPVIERVLKEKAGRVRHKDRRYSTRRPTLEPEPSPGVPNQRADHVTSQRVDVALIFQSMLNTETAAEYLRNAKVPVWVTVRVLGSGKRRPSPTLPVE